MPPTVAGRWTCLVSNVVKHLLCVSLEKRRRQVEGITILPYGEFLDALWGGAYRE